MFCDAPIFLRYLVFLKSSVYSVQLLYCRYCLQDEYTIGHWDFLSNLENWDKTH